MRKKEKSIAIMAFYDSEGIVDDYIIYYLNSLKVVVGRIIIAVNGFLLNDAKKRLLTITEELYFRNNAGFDFGAYKDVLENYLSTSDLDACQELILCNDTCFGPFLPFIEIFANMEKKDVEFWGINYCHDLLLPHLQSYFLVFSGKAISAALNFFHYEVDCEQVDITQAHGYEHGLNEEMFKQGIRWGYYTYGEPEKHTIDIFFAPDYAMIKYGFPMMKKNLFLLIRIKKRIV